MMAWMAWAATGIFVVITFLGDGPSTYRFAIFFLAPLLWCVYLLRERLHIHPCHFAIFAGALVLHNLGAFGSYRERYLGIQFDIYVHFVFGIAGGFIIARALKHCYSVRDWKLWPGTVLLLLGIGAIHELIEFASTLMLGPEKGMLKINSPEKFDTQKDLLNNLLGALAALAIYTFFSRWRARRGQGS